MVAILVVVGIVAAVAYFNSRNTKPIVEPDVVSYDDFDTYPTPRTFDGPGYVFRVDQEKKKFPVLKLDVRVESSGWESFSRQVKTTTWKLGALGEFLGDSKVVEQLKASGNADAEVRTEIELGTGSRYRTYDADIEVAVKKAKITYRRDSRYYVVREAVAVKKITLKIDREGGIDAKVEANLKKLARADGKTSVVLKDNTQLIADFGNEELFIFYKVDRLLPPGSGSQKSGEWQVLSPAEPEHADWIAEERQ